MRVSSRAVSEVTVVFLLVIGACKLLFAFRSVPFISQTLALWAAALFLYVPLALLSLRRVAPADWGITLRGLRRSLKLTALVSACCLPAFLLLYTLYRRVGFGMAAPIAFPPDWPVLLAYHLCCVAFPEEVFYRGYMQSRLREAFPPRMRILGAPLGFAWVYTALLFAVGHYLIDYRVDTLATFVPGLAFGWLRARTDSIVAPTLFHALCNGTVLLTR